jgi:membrane-associated phospholipid phosphatase
MNFLHNMDWVLPLRSDGATHLANAFTWLGYTTFFLIALPLSYWLWDRGRAMRLVILIAITAVINGWLKDLWQDPRPDPKYWLDQRVLGSYGRPSGHAQVAIAMWFWIAYELKRPWAWAAAAFIVAAVCLSRLYLGVHDIDDIVTGLTLGVIGIFIFMWFLSPTFAAIRNMPGVAHLAIIVAVGVVLFLTWPNGEKPDSTVGVLALLFGWVVGAQMDHRLAPNEPVLPAWWLRVLMGIVGVVVLFALQTSLVKAVHALGVEGTPASYAVSALLGFYMTGIAPWAFRAARLVK